MGCLLSCELLLVFMADEMEGSGWMVAGTMEMKEMKEMRTLGGIYG